MAYRRKIEVDTLRTGMYVVALDRPWLESDFLLEGVAIDTQDDIDQLKRQCNFVYISCDEPPPPEEEEDDGQSAASGGAAKPGDREPRSFHDELPAARATHHAARDLVLSVHDDVRKQARLDSGVIGDVVEQMMDSVARHPDALIWFTNLKDRDQYTAVHSLNVCLHAVTLATWVGMSDADTKEMGVGALLHDVGKLKVPLEILNKPGKLTDEEFAIIKRHPTYGVEILTGTSGLTQASLDIVRDHHERLNGRGYPAGLEAEQISYYNQLVAIADVYDAMTTDRVYQKGRDPASALKLMMSLKGEFNDELLRRFAESIGDYPAGTLVELNTGEVGFVLPPNRTDPEEPRPEKPTVLLVLDFKKRRYYPQRVRDLMRFPKFTVKEMLAPGTYGVNVDDYAAVIAE